MYKKDDNLFTNKKKDLIIARNFMIYYVKQFQYFFCTFFTSIIV